MHWDNFTIALTAFSIQIDEIARGTEYFTSHGLRSWSRAYIAPDHDINS